MRLVIQQILMESPLGVRQLGIFLGATDIALNRTQVEHPALR